MKAIICAAGKGKRLLPLTEDKPKTMVVIGEKTILEYLLDNLSECGIKEVVLIVGYKADVIRNKIGEKYKECNIKYYVNEDYDKTDNMYSLWVAREEINDDILFFNADIIFNKNILREIINSPYPNAVAVDDKIELVDDSMKVRFLDGKINSLGKKLDDANGWAIGMYKFSKDGAKKYYGEIKNLVESGAGTSSFVRPVELVAKQLDVFPVSTKGFPWAEIDDLNDLEIAKNRIGEIIKNDNEL